MPDSPYKYRNKDGSLRLDELLGERYVRHYTGILRSSNDEFAAMQLAMAPPEYEDPDPAWYVRPEPRGRLTPDGWMITPEGASVRGASSCQDLARLPEIVWDVCGYYRRLGVHWRATKKQILAAAIDKDPGRNDRGIAYATEQLLDPVIRRAYDLMPLGGLFLGDRDVREMIERRAAQEASARNAEAFFDDELTDHAEVLREWGFDPDASAEEARDRLAGTSFRSGSRDDELGSSLTDWEQDWGWYRLSDPYDGDQYADGLDAWQVLADGVAAVLEAWQAMVATALSGRGIRMTFAVGIWPGNGPKSWQDSKEGCIFFIGRGQMTQQMADEAVRGYAARRKTRDHQERKEIPGASSHQGRGGSRADF